MLVSHSQHRASTDGRTDAASIALTDPTDWVPNWSGKHLLGPVASLGARAVGTGGTGFVDASDVPAAIVTGRTRWADFPTLPGRWDMPTD